MIDIALEMLDMGLRPIPIKPGAKKPPLVRWKKYERRAPTLEEILKWWSRWPEANVAILTGTFPGATIAVDVVDFDPGHDPWPPEGNVLPTDCLIKTPRGGLHYHFLHTPGVANTQSTLADGIDVRGDGGYVLIPPSVVDGNPYRYITGSILDVKEPPGWLVQALLNTTSRFQQSIATSLCSSDPILPGTRNCTLASLAGSLRFQGKSRHEIETELFQINNRRCKPPLGLKEVRKIARSISRYKPGKRELDTSGIHIPHNVLATPHLSSSAKLCYGVMMKVGKRYSRIIAEEMGITHRQVNALIKQLEEAGLW